MQDWIKGCVKRKNIFFIRFIMQLHSRANPFLWNVYPHWHHHGSGPRQPLVFLFPCPTATRPAENWPAQPEVDLSCRAFWRPAGDIGRPAKPGGDFHPQGRSGLWQDGKIYLPGSLSRRQDAKSCSREPLFGGREPKFPAGCDFYPPEK